MIDDLQTSSLENPACPCQHCETKCWQRLKAILCCNILFFYTTHFSRPNVNKGESADARLCNSRTPGNCVQRKTTHVTVWSWCIIHVPHRSFYACRTHHQAIHEDVIVAKTEEALVRRVRRGSTMSFQPL
jgi:hypothetical protein